MIIATLHYGILHYWIESDSHIDYLSHRIRYVHTYSQAMTHTKSLT
jgi:hypothetical protein